MDIVDCSPSVQAREMDKIVAIYTWALEIAIGPRQMLILAKVDQ